MIIPKDPNDHAELPELEAYFEDSSGGGTFWIRDDDDLFMRVPEREVRSQLKELGVSSIPSPGNFVSGLDQSITKIRKGKRIHYAGPLAGFMLGSYKIEGIRVLVTRSPRIIEPLEGDWPTLEKVIENLFGAEQQTYFYGWLKMAYEALRAEKRRPGQAIVLAGKHDSGKSLLQSIITEVLGGRSANPMQFMAEGTGFNSDLFAAEHLVIDDEAGNRSSRKRSEFATRVKSITVVAKQRCHGKHREALILTPFWRLSISVNDEDSESLLVLPKLDASVEDKIMLFKTSKHSMPMPTTTTDQRELFWKTLMDELPAMLYALTQWEIPEDLKSPRFGITHYHHPELYAQIGELSPEARLLALIDKAYFSEGHGKTDVTAKAEEIERKLLDDYDIRDAAKKLFDNAFAQACGTYLGRLGHSQPNRVKKIFRKGAPFWRIFPPVLNLEGIEDSDDCED